MLPVEVSLGLLDAVHERWLVLLDSLSESQWIRTFMHPEVGPTGSTSCSRSIPGKGGITSRKSRRCGNAWAGRVMAWIKTVDPDDASGPLKAEYERAFARGGAAVEHPATPEPQPRAAQGFDGVLPAPAHVRRLSPFAGAGGRCWPSSSPAPTGAGIESTLTRTTSGARSPISGSARRTWLTHSSSPLRATGAGPGSAHGHRALRVRGGALNAPATIGPRASRGFARRASTTAPSMMRHR